ncbi:MAG: hypothetical protein DHS20C16_32600 [Phycisphaerae bacterium]|nr:MAG: hypothetical protein DHS20C16_32600 [Phycisphaerae bacterium]
MAKPSKNWIGVLGLVCAVATSNCAFAQVASNLHDEQLGPKQSFNNAEVAVDLQWPFRRCESNDDCPGNRYCFSWGGCDDPGVCRSRPNGCPDVWDPVCGCDGVTYSNKCDAAAAGVNVDHEGECDEVCGGIQGIPCSDPNDFCRFDEGQCCCDFQGVCTPIPDACPEYYDPVCGCDGVTYSNECFANAAGQSVDHQGACAMSCTSNSDCLSTSADPGKYCQKAVGDCDGSGECTDIPQGCYDVWDPVCGCDGVTYGNDCEAAAAGVSIAYLGECEDPCCDPADEPGVGGNPFCFEGASCCADGTWACNNANGTPSCDLGLVCDEIGKCCLEGGTCIETSEAKCYEKCGSFAGAGTSCTGPWDCPIPPIVIAACCLPDGSCEVTTECICERSGGTWGETVECSATACGGGGEVCGGIAGIPCSDPDDFCKLNEGECCCDFQGVCTPIPEVCPLIFDPVCGCDGQTYSNECFADAAGVSVDHQGTCDDGCQTNADCAFAGQIFGEYCQKATGDCDGTGSCSPVPQFCLDVWIPVCGCDGQTYSNTCYANRVGVNVAHEGACGFDQ